MRNEKEERLNSKKTLDSIKFKEKYYHCPDCDNPITTDVLGYYFCFKCRMIFKKEKGYSGKWDIVKTGETLDDMMILVSDNSIGVKFNVFDLYKPNIKSYHCKICKTKIEITQVRKILVNLKLCFNCYTDQINNVINDRIKIEIKEKEKNDLGNIVEYL